MIAAKKTKNQMAKKNTSANVDKTTGSVSRAVDAASEVGGGEVWVAMGVYDESRESASGALLLREDVDVFGGFAGTESRREDRDYATNVAIIDGATARNGSIRCGSMASWSAILAASSS